MNEGFYAIIAFLIAFAMAQIIKCVAGLIRADDFSWSRIKATIMASGGMPSGHVASLTAITTFIGLIQGVSITFAAMCAVLAIVAYDAVNVRWAVGEMGEVLNKLARRRLKVVRGHKISQVLVGLLLGVLVGIGVFLLYRLLNGGF